MDMTFRFADASKGSNPRRAGLRACAFQTQHLGYVGTVDVSVENPDSVASVSKRHSKIGRDGGFSHSSFAAHDDQPMFDGGQFSARRSSMCLC